MHVITFFAPKGGSGRTTSLMALASGLVQSGHLVGVLDITEQASSSSIIGQSFISQWSENMRTTGITPYQLTVEAASDEAGTFRALEQLSDADVDFILIDTPRNPNSLVLDWLDRSDLVVMPVTGAHEAAWASAWLNKNPQRVERHFGLITGARSDEERQLTRETFTGAPVLNVDLRRQVAFSQQIETGHLYSKPKYDTSRWGKFKKDEFDNAFDWTCACRCADALSREIISLIDNDGIEHYAVEAPLAEGGTFAHLNAILAQSRFQQI